MRMSKKRLTSPAILVAEKKPLLPALLLVLIVAGCFCCELFIPYDPAYMDLAHASEGPSRQFLFGTDTMGRDIFSMIWYGGRISLTIGLLATAVSALLAVLIGACSGLAPRWLDSLIMRLTEIILSVPNLLLVVLLQALWQQAGVLSISLVIGLTSWMSIAKVVRTEVRQLVHSDYVLASRCMGGGFFHILARHLAPNFFSSIMFMVIMNIRGAIVAESTLSFLGIGLPLEIISWGSMLSLTENSLLAGCWWIIVIPGLFLIATLMCITELGERLRGGRSRRHSNL